MPELRLAKARRSLPSDYQFGDAGKLRKRKRIIVTRWRSKDGTYHARLPQRWTVKQTEPFVCGGSDNAN